MNLRYAAWVAVLAVLGHLGWWQLRSGSAFRQIRTMAAKPVAAGTTKPLAPVARESDDGNVLLRLAGYAKTNPAVEKSLESFYYQASYVFYPRRVYAAPADQIINNGRDLMRADFHPGRAWLQEHNVRFELTFGNGRANREARWEIQPLDDSEAVGQTNRTGGN
jgi:hypothetical protein